MIWLKLKLRDKNRFLIRAFKQKITLYEIKEEKDVCYVKIDRQDKEKIKKMWFVKILDEKNIGLSRVKEKIYQKYSINRYCRKCGQQLLISDLKEYKYLCLECDENFYEFETINRK